MIRLVRAKFLKLRTTQVWFWMLLAAKIRIHVFYSVPALAIAHLMRREAETAGLHLSVRELLTTAAHDRPTR